VDSADSESRMVMGFDMRFELSVSATSVLKIAVFCGMTPCR
jgi:hypothetical protein